MGEHRFRENGCYFFAATSRKQWRLSEFQTTNKTTHLCLSPLGVLFSSLERFFVKLQHPEAAVSARYFVFARFCRSQ